MVEHFRVREQLKLRTEGKIDITHQTQTRYVREGLAPKPYLKSEGRKIGRTSEYRESTAAFIYAAHAMMFGQPRYTIAGVRDIIKKIKTDGSFGNGVFIARDGCTSISDEAVSKWGKDSEAQQKYLGHFLAYYDEPTTSETREEIYAEIQKTAENANIAIRDLFNSEYW